MRFDFTIYVYWYYRKYRSKLALSEISVCVIEAHLNNAVRDTEARAKNETMCQACRNERHKDSTELPIPIRWTYVLIKTWTGTETTSTFLRCKRKERWNVSREERRR